MKKLIFISLVIILPLISINIPKFGQVVSLEQIDNRFEFLINLMKTSDQELAKLQQSNVRQITTLFHPDSLGPTSKLHEQYAQLFTKIQQNLQQYLNFTTGKATGAEGSATTYTLYDVLKAKKELEELINGYEKDRGRTAPFTIAASPFKDTPPEASPEPMTTGEKIDELNDIIIDKGLSLTQKLDQLSEFIPSEEEVSEIPAPDVYMGRAPRGAELAQPFAYFKQRFNYLLKQKLKSLKDIKDYRSADIDDYLTFLDELQSFTEKYRYLIDHNLTELKYTVNELLTYRSNTSGELINKLINQHIKSMNPDITDAESKLYSELIKDNPSLTEVHTQATRLSSLINALPDTVKQNPDIQKIQSTLKDIENLKNTIYFIKERQSLLEALKKEGFFDKAVRYIKSAFNYKIDTIGRVEKTIKTNEVTANDTIKVAQKTLITDVGKTSDVLSQINNPTEPYEFHAEPEFM
ncbi:hypothetical protein A3F66_01875 [candidate division TM6 bacterium RIFCSPHIGHO2_12_FULL_32_22]|nr:MAG: hypothetical protein A3F66_01875 [candidate division TM6 bacterium RIFCSPHIGHO2_12_FULL_32_22]